MMTGKIRKKKKGSQVPATAQSHEKQSRLYR